MMNKEDPDTSREDPDATKSTLDIQDDQCPGLDRSCHSGGGGGNTIRRGDTFDRRVDTLDRSMASSSNDSRNTTLSNFSSHAFQVSSRRYQKVSDRQTYDYFFKCMPQQKNESHVNLIVTIIIFIGKSYMTYMTSVRLGIRLFVRFFAGDLRGRISNRRRAIQPQRRRRP